MKFTADPDEARLWLRYSGEAVSSGRMDAEEFTTALDGLRETLTACGALANGGELDQSLSISAERKVASFGFEVIFSQLPAIAHSLTPENFKTALEIVKIAFGEDGLVPLFKHTKGEPPSKIANRIDGAGNVVVQGDVNAPLTINNTVNVTVPLSGDMTVSPETWAAYLRPEIRRSLFDVMAPLSEGKIDALETTTEDGEHTFISADDAKHFVPRHDPAENEDRFDSYVDELTVVKQSFKPRRRWVFESLSGSFGALIQDPEFLRQQERREIAIYSGDRILAEIKRRTFRTDRRRKKQLEPEYFIVRVLKVIPPDGPGGGQLTFRF